MAGRSRDIGQGRVIGRAERKAGHDGLGEEQSKGQNRGIGKDGGQQIRQSGGVTEAGYSGW